jgi:hypothetical protein
MVGVELSLFFFRAGSLPSVLFLFSRAVMFLSCCWCWCCCWVVVFHG